MQINFYWLQYIPLLWCDVGLVPEVLIYKFFMVWYTLKQSGTCSATKHLEHSYLVSIFFFLALHTTQSRQGFFFLGFGGIGIFVIKLYSKPVCFCGYFIPQWVVDHELKNFQWVWFRRKIPDYGRFYPRISWKCNFDGLSPVTFHLQPCSFVIFCSGGVVVSLSLDSDFSTGSSSISLSLTHFLNFCHFLMKHCHLLHFQFLLNCVEFPFPTANTSCK